MNLSQTEKAISERQRRLNDREKRRHNIFVHDYICTKYKDIYNECNTFYQQLRNQYPTKLNLVKTYRYKKWKNQITTGEAESVHPESETVHPETVHPEPETVHPEPETVHPESVHPESETVHPETVHPEPETVHPETDTSETAQPILEEALQGLFPNSVEDVQGLSIEDMDRIVQEIISELEQDQGVRDLLPYIQAVPEEDEGIELNIETELGAIVEPFDNELDMEGAEW